MLGQKEADIVDVIHTEFKLLSYNFSFSDKKLITMRFWLNISDPPTGLYTVEVDGYTPFCV
jgi:hypothetical protein